MASRPTADREPGTWLQRWRAQLKPDRRDPWVKQKCVVVIVMALAVWDLYVGIGRVFAPSIHRDDGAPFGRPVAIGLLVAWLVLWLMFMWSYIVVISRGPGFAVDFVPTCPDPAHQNLEQLHDVTYDSHIVGSEHDKLPNPADYSPSPSSPTMTGASDPAATSEKPSDPVDDCSRSSHATKSSSEPHLTEKEPEHASRPESRVSDFAPPSGTQPAVDWPPAIKIPDRFVPRPVPYANRNPRWCRHCKIIKPDRTHHCRQCGTCILQFDHHCIWLGQCVGWGNHAIFIVFNLWAGIFCTFNMVILIIAMTQMSTIDPQKVVAIVLSGFLALFTLAGMLPTHIAFILAGRSTIESYASSSQRQAEDAALQQEFGNCAPREVRKVKRAWKEDFGGQAVNDRWRWGRSRDHWRQEMGRNVLGWVLPIGRPLGDGIHFTPNPRFGPYGMWLRKEDWPKVVAI